MDASPPQLGYVDERIVEYIRGGAHDAEIAVRLGMPVGELKARIVRIADRLGVSGRSALAAWDGTLAPLPFVPAEAAAARIAAALPAELGTPAARRSRVGHYVTAALVATATAGGLLWFAGQGREPPGVPASTASLKAAVEAIAAGTPQPGPPSLPPAPAAPAVRELTVGPVTVFPGRVLLYLPARGATGPEYLERLEWFGDAARRTAVLEVSLDERIDSVVTGASAADVLVAVYWPGPDMTRILRSGDGGLTWREEVRRAGRYSVLAVERGRVLVRRAAAKFTEGEAVTYSWLPDVPVRSPDDADRSVSPASGPEGLIWVSADRTYLITPRGNIPVRSGNLRPFVARDPGSGSLLYVEVYGNGLEDITRWVGADGQVKDAFGSALLRPVGFLSGHEVLVLPVLRPEAGEAAVTGLGSPAILNLLSATVSPLAEPMDGSAIAVAAIGRGDFVRVATPGDCLNLRDQPGGHGFVLGCAPDGSLLTVRDDTGPLPGWLPVRTPDGRDAWVSVEYLSR